MVPPVPAPATRTSTFPEEGLAGVDGVPTTASMISGPVVSSCAKGLLGYMNGVSASSCRKWILTSTE